LSTPHVQKTMACTLLLLAVVPALALQPLRVAPRRAAALRVGNIDPTSPEMMAEFEKLKDVSMADINAELEMMGIPTTPDMDDMSVKLRLMEARIIMGAPAAAGPPAGASAYEFLIYEKPEIKTYVDGLYNKGDINGANAFMEYVNDRPGAEMRYGKEDVYKAVFAVAEEMMAAPSFTSAKLSFAGFPMMGEDALRGQMESVGAVVTFSIDEEDPVLGCKGKVEFEEEASAVTAVDKWDGADMGNEVTLTLKYLA
jgi:hypothetical protein